MDQSITRRLDDTFKEVALGATTGPLAIVGMGQRHALHAKAYKPTHGGYPTPKPVAAPCGGVPGSLEQAEA